MNMAHRMRLVGLAVLYMIVNVGMSFVWVAFYAYGINPGQTTEFYQDYAQLSAPYSTILAGTPLIIGLGWWVGKRWGAALAVKSAVGIWLTYLVMDLTITGSVGMTPRLALFTAVSLATKLLGILLGVQFGLRRSTRAH